jgi:hypothetical protein
MRRTIWMYWETGKSASRPAYIDLCLETVRRHSPSYEVVLMNRNSVFTYLPDLRRDVFKTAEIAHRADYIRARVVYEYGGIWLDSDVILLSEIDIDSALGKYDFAGCGDTYRRPSIWFFAAKRRNPVLGSWISGMDSLLDRKRRNPLSFLRPYRFSWSRLGYDILWPLFEGYDYHHFDFRRFAPIRWDAWRNFFRVDLEPGEIIDADTIGVMLYNKFMFEPLSGESREDILNSNILLSKLFRLSLGI